MSQPPKQEPLSLRPLLIRDVMAEDGFTLIELCLVILIVGLILTPLFPMYTNYINQQKWQTTKDHVKQALSAMAVSDPRYAPCPADRSLPPTDPNYGVEQCDLVAIPNCNPGGIPAQGICQTAGSRDADGNGTVDRVVIGGVPKIMVDPTTGARTTILSGDAVLDGWGHWLNYAVSENVGDHTNTTGSDNYRYGVINAIDENLNRTAGVTAPGDAEFVVWSSGKNGAGAYDYQGILTAPCPAAAGNPQPNPREKANCDNDFTFMEGLGQFQGAGNTYFDDYTKFYFQTAGDLWAFAMRNNAPTQHIYNLNTGNVGIGTTTPAFPLTVFGDISAPTVRSPTFQTVSVNQGATGQIDMANPFGGLLCPNASDVVTGWDSRFGGKPICAQPTIASTPKTVDCQALFGNTFWVTGFSTTGCVICSNGTVDNNVSTSAGAPCTP